MNTEIFDRIKSEREAMNLTQTAFGAIAGVKKRTVIDWEKGSSSPTAVQLFALYCAGADANYILTGLKTITAGNSNAYSSSLLNDDIGEKSIDYTNNEYAEIPHYNVQAAAGSGRLATEEETLKPLSFRRDWLAKRHLTPANLAIVSVSGDSMEPYLKDEDLVLVDRSQITITSGKTYVLRLDGHLLVKNLQLLPHGLVQVASFNPGFPPYQVDLSDESLDMAVIGRVVASMHEW